MSKLEVHKLYYPSGKLSKRFTRNEDGLKHGLYESWHENGARKSEMSYEKGDPIDIVRAWHKNGQLRLERHLMGEGGGKKGFARRHGRETTWHPNGQLQHKSYFVHGKRDGLREAWYPNGMLSEQVEYKDGLLHGKWLQWHDNGKLEEELHYFEGKEHGTCINYYRNGMKETEGNYVHGLREGKHIQYAENIDVQVVSVVQNFRKGKLHGVVEYLTMGKDVRTRKFYVDGTDITPSVAEKFDIYNLTGEDYLLIELKWGIPCLK